MICTNCFEADQVTVTRLLKFSPEIGEVEMEECPKCGYVVFTQDQANEIDRRRRMHEERQ